MPEISRSEEIRQLAASYSLATTSVIAGIIARHRSGTITETHAQKLIDSTLRKSQPVTVDPYQTRLPPLDERRTIMRASGGARLDDVLG